MLFVCIQAQEHTTAFADLPTARCAAFFEATVLPEEYQAALNRHPIARLAKATSQGEGLFFFNAYLASAAALERHPQIPSWRYEVYLTASSDWKGELKQSVFLSQLLRTLFPRAGDSLESPDKIGSEHGRIDLDVFDPHGDLDGSISNYVKGTSVEMSRLKAANPGGYDLTKSNARSRLKIHPDKRLFHIYLTSFGRLDPGELAHLLWILQKSGRYDAIVVTTTKTIGDQFAIESARRTISGTLSEWLRSPDKFPRGAVVENDTIGEMPLIHAVSEAVMVMGPINWFEPLAVDTPTMIYVPSHLDEGFHPGRLRELITQAERTDGARRVKSLLEVGPLLDAWTNERPLISLPGLQPNSRGKTPFDLLLDDLDGYLRSQPAIRQRLSHAG